MAFQPVTNVKLRALKASFGPIQVADTTRHVGARHYLLLLHSTFSFLRLPLTKGNRGGKDKARCLECSSISFALLATCETIRSMIFRP